ncbi:FIVAR domain-containing protein, partial [Faecalimonas umbilicata]|nr:FIVAR domain-containing protein [Faecalimonas umbilicata]
ADILGENSVLYIGYSTWKSGEYATAEIDNYRIIGRSFTEEEIKADLKAAIDKEVGEEADYTPGSWKTYEDALAEAEAVYGDKDATRAEVNEAEAALTKAQNALTKKADKTALDAAI